jgi:AcrR family transcriptional regulator
MNDKLSLKDRIIIKSGEIFFKSGFKSVTTDDLAKALGISKRTLYSYFPSKENLIDVIIDTEISNTKSKFEEFLNRMENNDNCDALTCALEMWDLSSESIFRYSKEFFCDLKTFLPLTWAKIVDCRENSSKSNYHKFMKLGRKKRIFKKNLSDDIIFLMSFYSVQNLMTPEILSELPYTSKEVMDTVKDILLTGTLTEEAQQEYLKNHKKVKISRN